MIIMKFFVVTVLLATCLGVQAKNLFQYPKRNFFSEYSHKDEGSRIINGQPAESGQFPYQAALVMARWFQEPEFCGGSIISREWILTAAHCAENGMYWDIKLGGISLSSNEPGQILTRSYHAIIHENYNKPQAPNNDIALVQLPEAITYTDLIKPIRLIGKSEATAPLDKIPARVSGWGSTKDGGTVSLSMNFVDVDTISNEDCRKIYGPAGVLDNNICAVGRPNHSPCNGDSGGPLVRFDEDGEVTEIGLVSYVLGGCSNGVPVVYVRPGSFLDWINHHTGIPIRD